MSVRKPVGAGAQPGAAQIPARGPSSAVAGARSPECEWYLKSLDAWRQPRGSPAQKGRRARNPTGVQSSHYYTREFAERLRPGAEKVNGGIWSGTGRDLDAFPTPLSRRGERRGPRRQNSRGPSSACLPALERRSAPPWRAEDRLLPSRVGLICGPSPQRDGILGEGLAEEAVDHAEFIGFRH